MSSQIYKGLIATAVLVCTQVTIGLLFKVSQSHGHYEFSQASSLTITECIKLAVSVLLYRAEAQSRISTSRYSPNLVKRADDEKKLLSESNSSTRSLDKQLEEGYDRAFATSEGLPIPYDRSRQALYECWKREINGGIIFGFCGLALLYVINNNTVFFVYLLADPGTIQLVKASTTIISALIMRLFLARSIRELQWHALILQTGGLMVTQMGNINLNYAPSTYALLLGMTCISAIAGVWNDHLSKSYNASLHAENIVMYLGGIALNLAIYAYKKTNNWDTEPAFFAGYGSSGAVALLILNACIGIVITAVYKYADAIYKSLATSITTALMLIISSTCFSVSLTNTALTGCAVVFMASYTYIKAGTKPPTGPKTLADGTIVQRAKPRKQMILGILFVLSVVTGVVYTCITYGITLPTERPAPPQTSFTPPPVVQQSLHLPEMLPVLHTTTVIVTRDRFIQPVQPITSQAIDEVSARSIVPAAPSVPTTTARLVPTVPNTPARVQEDLPLLGETLDEFDTPVEVGMDASQLYAHQGDLEDSLLLAEDENLFSPSPVEELNRGQSRHRVRATGH